MFPYYGGWVWYVVASAEQSLDAFAWVSVSGYGGVNRIDYRSD